MKIGYIKNINNRPKADYLILPFLEDKVKPIALCDVAKFAKIIQDPIENKDFKGKEKEISIVYGAKEGRILLLGLGKSDKINLVNIAEIYADAVAYLRKKKASSANLVIPQKINISKEDLIKAITEALYLANYSFNKFKYDKEDLPSDLKTVCLIGIDKDDMKIVNEAKVIASGVNFTRDLVNNNAEEETPQNLAKVAKDLKNISKKIKVSVLDKKKIKQENMGLFLAVNKGSDKDPFFIIAEYKGNPSSKDKTAIVGKGITYDSGGLNLKPEMTTMKADMSGAAATLGVIYTVANLNLKVNVVGIVPATENAIGPASYKPGDVFIGMSGKSVEIKNTDAEGRLILADALTYAVKKIKPTRIIDIASLTGACVVALGDYISGLFCNSEKLAEQLESASKRTGDLVWRMPLHQKYKEQLKSDIADLKNIAEGREGGAILAALFLEEFVEKINWAHLDIAGPNFLKKTSALHPTHATGSGVRLLVNFLESLSKKL